MILMPKTGSELISTGNKAQCIAQRMDVPMPKASQFSLIFIIIMENKDRIFAIMLQMLTIALAKF